MYLSTNKICISKLSVELIARSNMARFHVSVVAAVLLILTLTLGASRSASQKEGFYSINCGGEAYIDPNTKIKWQADPFNDDSYEGIHGRVAKVKSSVKNITNVMRSLRYFPNDSRRNRKFCYSLSHSVSKGDTYVVRVSFLYGNYDGLKRPPKFVLIFNYDEWTDVTTSNSTTPIVHELTFIYNDPDFNICLAPHSNYNETPFISTLEIRKLTNSMYINPTYSSALSQGYGLMLWQRLNYGARSKAEIRYPDDPYDRIWEADTRGPAVSINASKVSSNYSSDLSEPAAEVMATAITSKDPKGNLSFTYKGYGGDQGWRMEMHFEELDETASSPRNFSIALPNSTIVFFDRPYIVPANTYSVSKVYDTQVEIPLNLHLTLFPSPASLRGPLLNAIELFHWTPQQLSITRTYQGDVDTIKTIQTYFKLTWRYGQGDPCMPERFAWTWIVCNVDIQPRIIEINLASFNLTGDFPSSINNLTKLKKIDLSNNNLSGEMPNLNRLLDLESLDMHGNNLSGQLPSYLIFLPKLAKLDVSYNNLCGSSPSFQTLMINYTHLGNNRLCAATLECNCSLSIAPNLPKRSNNRRKYIVSILSLGALYVVSTLTLLIIYKARRRNRAYEKKSTSTLLVDNEGVGDLKTLPFMIKMFTYNEISDATLNFTTILGEGGFGKVYRGLLPTGELIAVKMLADASKQGLKEFYNEVAILSRVRHKNLVSLIGYCVENSYILVYEYIAKGNIRDLIYGEVESTDKSLPWTTRLQIALDASQGLEYLHTGCDPAIIHRDVKSNNILLSENMTAKVADFGLSRLKEGDNTNSHVSTINVMGTAGYLDPAYNATNQLTDKSDVYSFGIVLFELICGRAPIDMFCTPSHIVDWASQLVAQGKLGEIVDPILANGYKMESMRKVVDLAFGCVESNRMRRPKMSEVSELLQNALEIEMEPKNYSPDISGGSSTSNGKLPTLHYIKNL